MPASVDYYPQISVEGSLTATPTPKTGRVQRRPSHPFYLEYYPYQLQPFVFAPVLPGETMKNALIQARCVTDPIKNKLIGWWNEYYLFYVKLSDLQTTGAWPEYSDMLLTNTPPSTIFTRGAVADYPWTYVNGGECFVRACVQEVVTHYFRDEEELANNAILDNDRGQILMAGPNQVTWKCKVPTSNAFQSLTLDTDTPASEVEELPGEGMPSLPSHMAGFAESYAQWQEMVAMQMTAATYEDWLRSYGVSAPAEQREELHIPELLRYVRDFQYPSNAVNPVDGTVASAVSWSIAERADKDRFFAEPGFILGITTSRPKVYLNKQAGSVSSFMNSAYAWLPAILAADPYTSLKKFTNAVGTGPIVDLAGDYWLDMRDLFMYGEQFTNVALTAAHLNVVTVPDDQAAVSGIPLNNCYASDADIVAFFADAANSFVRVDGRVDFNILSRIVDTTP